MSNCTIVVRWNWKSHYINVYVYSKQCCILTLNFWVFQLVLIYIHSIENISRHIKYHIIIYFQKDTCTLLKLRNHHVNFHSRPLCPQAMADHHFQLIRRLFAILFSSRPLGSLFLSIPAGEYFSIGPIDELTENGGLPWPADIMTRCGNWRKSSHIKKSKILLTIFITNLSRFRERYFFRLNLVLQKNIVQAIKHAIMRYIFRLNVIYKTHKHN